MNLLSGQRILRWPVCVAHFYMPTFLFSPLTFTLQALFLNISTEIFYKNRDKSYGIVSKYALTLEAFSVGSHSSSSSSCSFKNHIATSS